MTRNATGNRRYRRYRKRRTTSTRNIFSRTSARSQANQIYKLQRYVRYVDKRTRNTVQQMNARLQGPNYTDLTNSSFPVAFWVPPLTKPVVATTSTGLTYMPERRGHTPSEEWRIHGLRLYGLLQPKKSLAVDATPYTSGFAVYRITVLQLRESRAQVLTPDSVYSAIWTNELTTEASRSAQAYGPLQEGITRSCRVLYDKRYTLNFSNRQALAFNINLRRGFTDYELDTDSATSNSTGDDDNQVAKGTIYVMVALDGPSLEAYSWVNLNCKLLYSDKN